MKKQNTPIKLKGKTVKKQVNQFMSLLKDKSVPIEKLKEIMPSNTEFLRGLIGVIEKEVEANKEGYAAYLQTVDTIIACLKKICEDDKITPEERKQVIDSVMKIGEINRDVEEHHNKRRHWTIRWLTTLGTLLMALIVIVVGKKD